MDTLVNDFAIRSFRETADKDYITARMTYRARLFQPYLWSALHCLEKYVKGILLLNRLNASDISHGVLHGIERQKNQGKFKLDLSSITVKFIENLETYGAKYRYFEVSYETEKFELYRLDLAVWELRRYCQPLDVNIIDSNGQSVNLLASELDRVHQAKERYEKGTCVIGGTLENIINDKSHPARESLTWMNLYFGAARRKKIKVPDYWEAGNSPFSLHPEIIDEVEKYVHIPKDIAEGARQFAKQREREKTKMALDE